MTVVVDASVLLAAMVDVGVEGVWAEGVVAAGGLVAPHLVLVGATSILRRLELSGRLSQLEAGAAARDLRFLEIELVPFEHLAERVWELRRNLTSYDASGTWHWPKRSTFPWRPSIAVSLRPAVLAADSPCHRLQTFYDAGRSASA